jgi:hypothetical protein
MKNLILFLSLFFFGSVAAQTANYTLTNDDYQKVVFNNHTYIFETYDTLSGANDTLLISFPQSFPAHYGYNLTATWLATSTCTDGGVRLQGRNNTYEDWQNIGSVSFGSAGMSENDNEFTNGTEGYMQLRLRCINVDNIAHIRTTLVLKRI